MAISDAQFLKGWKDVLGMCNLKAGEQVTILTSDDSNKQIAFIAKLAKLDLPPISFVGHGIGLHLHEDPYLGLMASVYKRHKIIRRAIATAGRKESRHLIAP